MDFLFDTSFCKKIDLCPLGIFPLFPFALLFVSRLDLRIFIEVLAHGREPKFSFVGIQ